MQEIFNLLGIGGFEIADQVQGFLSLTVFTVLAQCGAGMAILKALCPRSERNTRFPLWALIAGIFVAIGTGVSLLHLNDPMRAPFALSNPLESWLSMEIYAVSFFGLTLLACLFVKKYIVRLISGLAAAFMVYSMAQVYLNTSANAWTTVNTYVTFYSSTLLLGAVGLLCASLLARKDKISVLSGVLPKLVLLFLVVRMVSVALLVLRAERAGIQANIPLMDMHITFTIFGAGFILICMMQTCMKYMIRVMHGEKELMGRVKESKKATAKDNKKQDNEKDDNIDNWQVDRKGSSVQSVSQEEKNALVYGENIIEAKDNENNDEKDNKDNEKQTDNVVELSESADTPKEMSENVDNVKQNAKQEVKQHKSSKTKHSCTHFIKMKKVAFTSLFMLTFVILGELAGRFMFYLLYTNTGL